MLQLPDPCLLGVLRFCDTRSICSAARAHSRLHQAAVAALTSFTLDTSRINNHQQRLDSLVDVYLPRHGEHVDSISLGAVHLRHLPTTLTQLTSLTARGTDIQLLPGCGFQGVLGAAVTPPLKRLRLHECILMMDFEEGLTAALALLSGLEHLSLIDNSNMITDEEVAAGGGNVLRKLPQLTHLELGGVWQENYSTGIDTVDAVGANTFKLRDLTALTRLADLRLMLPGYPCCIKASMLSNSQHLTHLQLQTNSGYELCFEPGALAGKTLLQHLELRYCYMAGHASGVAQLLSELHQMQQLTCLIIKRSLYEQEGNPPAAAYSALTTSSKLQRLEVSDGSFPAGVWQYVFPAGRQLPHLRMLDISGMSGCPLTAAEGSGLVRCCPVLQSLNMQRLQLACSPELLGALQGLSSLHQLLLQPPAGSAKGWVEVLDRVCQLTGLRGLRLLAPSVATEGLPLQLTKLRHLTYLNYSSQHCTHSLYGKVSPCAFLRKVFVLLHPEQPTLMVVLVLYIMCMWVAEAWQCHHIWFSARCLWLA
jgi:Leucine-rich repeat (LRR) protein